MTGTGYGAPSAPVLTGSAYGVPSPAPVVYPEYPEYPALVEYPEYPAEYPEYWLASWLAASATGWLV